MWRTVHVDVTTIPWYVYSGISMAVRINSNEVLIATTIVYAGIFSVPTHSCILPRSPTWVILLYSCNTLPMVCHITLQMVNNTHTLQHKTDQALHQCVARSKPCHRYTGKTINQLSKSTILSYTVQSALVVDIIPLCQSCAWLLCTQVRN